MHLTSKQEEALKTYIIEKIDELHQYLIIHDEAAQFIFTQITDQSIPNGMAFVHRINSKIPNWKLADNHPLVSKELKESNETKLFDFFNFLRLGGSYCKELREAEKIEFTGDEILTKINDIFYQYITTELGLKLPPRQKDNNQEKVIEVSQENMPVISANIAVHPTVNKQEFDLKSLMSATTISDDQKSILQFIVSDIGASQKERDMARLILARHQKEALPKVSTNFLVANTPKKQLSKSDLLEIQKDISEKLNLLLSLVLKTDDAIIQLFQELIKNVMKEVNSTINDILDLDDDFTILTSSLARGTGKNIFAIVSAFRKNIKTLIASKDEITKAEINEISSALSLTFIPFGVEDVHPDQDVIDWNEWRLRIEQERLHSTSSNHFYDTLSKVKNRLNNINTIKNCYIFCAENEMSYSELSNDVWTYTFIETLTEDLKKAGLNIESSQSCKKKLISTFQRQEKINLAKNIFIIGTRTLLPSIKKNNSSASYEMLFALNKAEEDVPLIFVLLSGSKAISLPNPSHLPQLSFLVNKEERDVKIFSYIELMQFFITYSVGDEISKQCNLYWYELALLSKIPRGGISHQEVIDHLQKKENLVYKPSASLKADRLKRINEKMESPVTKISNTNGVLSIENMQLTEGEKIELKDSKLSLTLTGNNFLLKGIGAQPAPQYQSTRSELNKSSLNEKFPIKVVMNVNVGNAVFLTGNHPNLGKWEKAIRLSYTKDNIWSAELPNNTLGSEFKFLIGSYDIGTIAPASALIWEEGPQSQALF